MPRRSPFLITLTRDERAALEAQARKYTSPCLRGQWPTLTLVHTPNHASWLNQVEIYFSVVQRKVVTPNEFTSLRELEDRLLAFQARYEQTAKPFQWTFTRPTSSLCWPS